MTFPGSAEDDAAFAEINLPFLLRAKDARGDIRGISLIDTDKKLRVSVGTADAEYDVRVVDFFNNARSRETPSGLLPEPLWECLFGFREHWLLSCREPAVDRLYLSYQKRQSGFPAAMESLQRLAGGSGNDGYVLRGDTVAGQLSRPAETLRALLPEEEQLPEIWRSLYGLADSQRLRDCLSECLDQGEQLRSLQLAGQQQRLLIQRIRFAPHLLIVANTANTLTAEQLEHIVRTLADDVLRETINQLLASGLEVPNTDLPEDDHSFQAIINELRKQDMDDLQQHLIVGGFANHSLGDTGDMEAGDMVLRCQECIYYLPHRRWCDLPELPLPVEAHWYCRLWKL